MSQRTGCSEAYTLDLTLTSIPDDLPDPRGTLCPASVSLHARSLFPGVLQHPHPAGCRDWGDAPPSPGGLEHPSLSACSQQLPKANHQRPTGLAWLCCFSKIRKSNKRGNINFSLALRGSSAHLHTPWMQRAGAATTQDEPREVTTPPPHCWRAQSHPIPIPASLCHHPCRVPSSRGERVRLSSWLVEDLARLFNQGE